MVQETPGTRLREARKLKFKSAQAAARAIGVNPVTYTAHENGGKNFDADQATHYGNAFGVDPAYLMFGRAQDATDAGSAFEALGITPTRSKPNASFPPKFQEFPQGRRIPQLGQVSAGTNGRFIMNGTKIADVFCPPGLENVPNAYAVLIYGTSMEPRFSAGETVWLNPQAPVRAGDDVVVQLAGEHEGDEMESYVKQFRQLSSKILKLWQHNPEESEPNEMVFDAGRVFSIHKVVYHAMV
jgi:phage repressor protein C with HTH and peptisase S24 domain